jgi:hypothetical protein
VENIHAVVTQDSRLPNVLLAELLGVAKEAARQILDKRFAEKEDLFEDLPPS